MLKTSGTMFQKNIARAAAVMHIVMRKQQIWSQAVSRRDYRALFKD
jgi:hypothetical protein